MNTCYLALGSNQKNPQRQLRSAIAAIKQIPKTYITGVSSLYKSKAWGLTTQQDFYNAVLEIQTTIQPKVLLFFCRKIEQNQGRIRKRRWGPRTLDIDIIFYGSRVINTAQLRIPHPHYKEREFVVKPLMEIAPEFVTDI